MPESSLASQLANFLPISESPNISIPSPQAKDVVPRIADDLVLLDKTIRQHGFRLDTRGNDLVLDMIKYHYLEENHYSKMVLVAIHINSGPVHHHHFLSARHPRTL